MNQTGRRFNVLNFGVEGYGPGQSLLHYEHFRYAENLAHVFYVYCEENDLRDIVYTGLFHLDEAGRLVQHEALRSSWWVTRMGRLHLPYLILDASGRLSSYVEERARHDKRMRERLEEDRNQNSELFWKRTAKRRAIFRGLMRRWKQLVEHNGGTFHVVLLPEHDPAASPHVPAILREEDIATISLYDCFGASDAEHYRTPWSHSPYRFKTDAHWNEAGNRLAAQCLYRVLEADMGLPAVSEETLRATLYRYYAAFEGWLLVHPDEAGKEAPRPSLSSPTAGIREKYQALDIPTFRVSLSDGFLVYHKEGCRSADLSARFFLHVTPVNAADLPEDRARSGFDKRDFRASSFQGGKNPCTVKIRLPDYAIRHIHTGQFVRGVENGVIRTEKLWKANIVPPAFRAPAFRVSLSDGFLVYHKEGCRPADLSARFFVHVTPVNKADLPEGRARFGFDNRDFRASSYQGDENPCTVRTRLPDYVFRYIRTGQFVNVEENGVTSSVTLWKTHINPPRFGQD